MKHLWTLSALVTFSIAGCADPSAPGNPSLTGSYSATQFSTTVGGRTLDRIAEGLVLNISLREDSTTTGFLAIGEDTIRFAGTWDSTQATVHLHRTTVDLLELLPLHLVPPLLVGDSTFGAVRFRVTLKRNADR